MCNQAVASCPAVWIESRDIPRTEAVGIVWPLCDDQQPIHAGSTFAASMGPVPVPR